MPTLDNIQYWGKNLGLLPMKLFSANKEPDENRFILLDGGIGDFCLQVGEGIGNDEYYNSAAWSANTKNFLVYENNFVKIFNWKKNIVETISSEKIENKLSTFYDYLTQNNYKSQQDITPFIIGIFKQLRNLTNETKEGINSLKLLFVLLTTLEEPEFSNIDFSKWGLSEVHLPSGFTNYVELLHNGISQRIKPKLDLILRHSSGTLFQEAHKEIIFFNKQFDLWGNISGDVAAKKLLYSSIHYTPSYLARTIVENVLKNIDLTQPSLKIFDPACGSSEFLSEILKQLKSKSYPGELKIIGWDSSESAIAISNFLLQYQKKEWENISIEISKVEDSLKEDWNNDYDIIVMNPPFVSYELMNKQDRESVTDTLGSLVGRRPNQASAFIYKAIKALKNNGIIGCVTPSSFFSFSAYSNLRKELEEIVCFHVLGKLGTFVFEDALADVSILIAQKRQENNMSPTIIWAKNEKGAVSQALKELRKFEKFNTPFIDNKNYSVYVSNKFPINDENWKLLSYTENESIKKIERMIDQGSLVRVKDLFDVRLGVRMGSSIFKIGIDYFETLPPNEQKYFRPVIDNDAIEKGVIETKNFIWYPYSQSKILLETEEDLKEHVPKYYNEILLINKSKLSIRSRKTEQNWWLLSEPLAWPRKKTKKLVSTEFGKAGSFGIDIKGNLVVERGNAWFPKKEFDSFDSNYFYLSIFSSSIFNELLSIYSKQLLSGWDLGKKSTQNIPIPSVFSDEIRNSFYYKKLVDLGKLISDGELLHFESILNEIIKHLYQSF